jgi:hypothetical protein
MSEPRLGVLGLRLGDLAFNLGDPLCSYIMPKPFLVPAPEMGSPSALLRRFLLEGTKLENLITFCLDAGFGNETVGIGGREKL